MIFFLNFLKYFQLFVIFHLVKFLTLNFLLLNFLFQDLKTINFFLFSILIFLTGFIDYFIEFFQKKL